MHPRGSKYLDEPKPTPHIQPSFSHCHSTLIIDNSASSESLTIIKAGSPALRDPRHAPIIPPPYILQAPVNSSRLVPPHARKKLFSRDIDIDNFIPMLQEEMMAHLGVRYLALNRA